MDTISRQAAIDYCYALINAENPSDPSDEWNYSQERINQTEVILHHLEFMPSAQPEIVRCRDCIAYQEGIDIDGKPFTRCNGSVRTYGQTLPDWFCADAERREE